MADFTFYKGSDRNFVVTWAQGGSPLNLTGATVTVNFKIKATDTASVLTKSTGNGGVTLTTPASGIMTINMDEADFADLGAAETELQVGITVAVGTRTYKKPFTVNVVTVP